MQTSCILLVTKRRPELLLPSIATIYQSQQQQQRFCKITADTKLNIGTLEIIGKLSMEMAWRQAGANFKWQI